MKRRCSSAQATYQEVQRTRDLLLIGAHPGGGVMGAPGPNAAREILKDLRWGRRQAARMGKRP